MSIVLICEKYSHRCLQYSKMECVLNSLTSNSGVYVDGSKSADRNRNVFSAFEMYRTLRFTRRHLSEETLDDDFF